MKAPLITHHAHLAAGPTLTLTLTLTLTFVAPVHAQILLPIVPQTHAPLLGADFAFVVNATVGTPGQPVLLLVAPSEYDTWLPDATANPVVRMRSHEAEGEVSPIQEDPDWARHHGGLGRLDQVWGHGALKHQLE
ncbi:hypothetical protein P8C59_000980 [Phyllachora maydis]|uniref:Uncharacterized protein n=1 Tax=Phyllachora maydis TaxID=1825666 RepID=A0AAD9HYR7_9PEZI|nr:hypothetical protein P8C59_000980 [Phyllachora maydis]